MNTTQLHALLMLVADLRQQLGEALEENVALRRQIEALTPGEHECTSR